LQSHKNVISEEELKFNFPLLNVFAFGQTAKLSPKAQGDIFDILFFFVEFEDSDPKDPDRIQILFLG
jgi:hypothetical protein